MLKDNWKKTSKTLLFGMELYSIMNFNMLEMEI